MEITTKRLQLLQHEEVETDQLSWFLNWMRRCYQFDFLEILKFTDEFSSLGREQQKGRMLFALDVLRECLMINYADHTLIRLDGKELDDIRRLAALINRTNAPQFAEAFNDAHYHLERNANAKILFTDLSIRMARLIKMPEAIHSVS